MARRRRKPPKAPLTPTQRRRRRQDKDPLLNPARPLSGHRLAEAVDKVVELEYGPKLAAIGREARSAEQQGTALINRAGTTSQAVADRTAAGVARQQALGEALRAALGKTAQEGQQAVQASGDELLERLAADRVNRGQGLDGGGDEQLQRELAAQWARSAQTGQAYKSSGDLQASRSAELQNAIAGTQALRGQEIGGDLANRLAQQMADARAKRTELESSRGDARSKLTLDLRQKGFEELVTARGLDIKFADLEADVANQRANRRIARERVSATRRGQTLSSRDRRAGQQVTRRGQDLSHADRVAAEQGRERRAAAKKQKAAQRKAERESALQIKRAIGNVADEFKFELLKPGATPQSVEKILKKRARNADQQLPADVLIAARELATRTYLTPGMAARLRALGVRVPPAWRAPAAHPRT